MKNKLKKITAFMAAALFAVNAWSKEVQLWPAEKGEVSIQSGTEYSLYADSTSGQLSAYSLLTVENENANIITGIRGSSVRTDFMVSALYAPEFFNLFKAGLCFSYHFYNYNNTFAENDFLPGIYLEWCKDSFFNLKWYSCYLRKDSVIPSVSKTRAYLPTNTFGYMMDLNWNYDDWKWYLDLTTFDYFDYPIFFSPIFATGFEKGVNSFLKAGVKISSEWIDMFTIAANPTNLICDVYFKVGF